MAITIRIEDDGIIRAVTTNRKCGCGVAKTDEAGPPLDPDPPCPAGVGVYVEHCERKADGSCVKTMQPV